MQYRRFGRTELNMPVISTGGMRYQDGWKDKPLSEVDPENQRNLEATIRHSIELGIHHIETARGYGCSERQLGLVLPTLPRDEIIVQTKVAPCDDPDEFTAHVHESLERLQLDHVDLLGLHGLNNAETIDLAVRRGGCLDAARELQRKGKVRHVGFSTHAPLDPLMRALRGAEDRGGGDFDYVNLHYYYIFQRNRPAVLEAARRDMGVFIISPSDKGGKLYAPPPALTELCDPLHPIEFNDLWCLRHPEVHTLSLGAAKPGDYDLHVSAVEKMGRADELLPPIEARLEAAMAEATGDASPEAASWAGVPEHTEAPGGLNLPLMLWLDRLDRGWGMTEYAKMRFNLFGNGGHWFPGRKVAEFGEVPEAEIAAAVAASPFADAIPGWLRSAVDRLGGAEVKRQSAGD
ncbi:MAG: aldo/keto reductase [Planctomycetota bacterium]